MRERRITMALMLALLLPIQGGAQQPEPFAQFDAYFQLIDQYRQGGNDEVVTALTRLPRADVEGAVETWARFVTDSGYRRFIPQRRSLASVLDRRSFEAAAVLHTVAGMMAFDAGNASPSGSHFSFANRIIGLRNTAAPPQRFEERQDYQLFDGDWHRLVATFYHSRRMPESAGPYMEKALALLPDDPAIMLAAARLFEASHAAQTTQTLPQRSLSAYARGPARQQALVEHLRAEQDIARVEALLRAAIAREHEPVLARLRLGRVLYARGRHKEAAAELLTVTKLPHLPSTGYLAHVFLARIAEEQRDVSTAIAHYGAATRLQVSNQTARIAMGRLLAESGRRDEARDVILATLMTLRTLSDDPWWLYYYPDESALPTLIDALRKRTQ